ncbi:MAG: hypothetical protein AAF489_04470 [Bacteroidota bacterium]
MKNRFKNRTGIRNDLKRAFSVLSLLLLCISCTQEEIQNDDLTNPLAIENYTAPLPNNELTLGGPDLVVTSISSNLPVVTPSSCGGGSAQQPTCGVAYTLTVVVTNIGSTSVNSFYTLRIGKVTGIPFINDFTSPTGSLAAGASHVFTIGPAPFGGCSGSWSRQTIFGFADVFNAVAETNESNNRSQGYSYCGD